MFVLFIIYGINLRFISINTMITHTGKKYTILYLYKRAHKMYLVLKKTIHVQLNSRIKYLKFIRANFDGRALNKTNQKTGG